MPEVKDSLAVPSGGPLGHAVPSWAPGVTSVHQRWPQSVSGCAPSFHGLALSSAVVWLPLSLRFGGCSVSCRLLTCQLTAAVLVVLQLGLGLGFVFLTCTKSQSPEVPLLPLRLWFHTHSKQRTSRCRLCPCAQPPSTPLVPHSLCSSGCPGCAAGSEQWKARTQTPGGFVTVHVTALPR